MKNHDTFQKNFNGLSAKERSGYYLDSYMTRGGQAWIFNATHGPNEVVVKAFMEPHDEQTITDFKHEARYLQALSESPHIIKVHWLDSVPMHVGKGRHRAVEHYPYMAMEKAEGGSVKDRLDDGRLDSEQALEWLVQAMEGIRYAHGEERPGSEGMRITHRDIKPANLLIVDGKVKVADFGIAVSGHSTDNTITKTQLVMGSPAYMAPEQFEGAAVFGTDRYAIGVTGLQMITGKLPITATNDGPIAWLRAHENFVPQLHPLYLPDGRVDEIGMAMQEPLMQALAKNVDDRYPSMGAFQEALIEAAERGRQQLVAARTYIDLGKATMHSSAATDETTAAYVQTQEQGESPTEALTQPFTLTMLLRQQPDKTQELAVEPEPEQPEPESPKEVTRRRLLNLFMVGAVTTVVGGVGYEYFSGNADPGQSNTYEKSEQELKNITATTKWLIEQFKANGQDNDVFFMVRALIPVDHKMASEYIDTMPLDKASFLAADLAFYDPVKAEKIMKKYEAKKDWTSAARIAMALAFYGKQKRDENNVDFPSGTPVDPARKQAIDAADRIKFDSRDNDIQEAINVARSYAYAYKGFAGHQGDTAIELLSRFRVQGKHELVEMLCRTLARDHFPAVKECIDYYISEAAKNNTDHDQMLGRARDLVIDLAPFNGSMAGDYLNKLAKETGTDYGAAADAIALSLAPYNASTVAAYVKRGDFKNTAQFPIGVAVAVHMPVFLQEFKKRVSEPVTSWLNYSLKVSDETLAQKAKDTLKSGDAIKTYGYWLGTALLRSQTDIQK